LEVTATRLSQLPLSDLTARLASREPIPGGGSASAIAGAMGAALVGMVAELTVGRRDALAHAAEIEPIRDEAARLRAELLGLAEADAAAYEAVVRARRLPRGVDEEAEVRRAAIATATRGATEAPLRIARTAASVLELAHRLAPIGNPNAASDAGVAALLAAAAVRGAALNVRINLPYLAADDPLRAQAPGELAGLETRAAQLEGTTRDTVDRRISPS
jgi:formiminotetrahydrofolate cyclodeaminase